MTQEEYEGIGKKVLDAAFEVHTILGPGLLESVYECCLMEELKLRGLKAENQVALPIVYKNNLLKKEFYIDILVEDEIVIELKAVELLLPIHGVQTLTYMRLANKKLGYLINFNEYHLKDGIKRKVNNYFI